jgi:hypothetical protein
MESLKSLRSLLTEALEVLRQAVPEFEDHPLGEKLEKTLRDLTGELLPKADGPVKATAQQVALAWQAACRDLKFSHPALHEELHTRVMRTLDERELIDPASELLQLESQVKKAEARFKLAQERMIERDRAFLVLSRQVDALCKALAEAAPQVVGVSDPHTLALQRIAELAAGKAAPPARKGAQRSAMDDQVPSRVVLEAVAAGQRQFTKDQRDWSVTECLGLTGWQHTPIELMEFGDAWMAEKILASPHAPG